MITQRGASTQETIKKTSNAKLESFVDEMFRLKFTKEQIKEELSKYICDIETGYADMIRKYKSLYRQAVERVRKHKRQEGARSGSVSHL